MTKNELIWKMVQEIEKLALDAGKVGSGLITSKPGEITENAFSNIALEDRINDLESKNIKLYDDWVTALNLLKQKQEEFGAAIAAATTDTPEMAEVKSILSATIDGMYDVGQPEQYTVYFGNGSMPLDKLRKAIGWKPKEVAP